MLRWRLLLGTLIILVLAGLCWLDRDSAVPGLWLSPVAVLFALGASQEMVSLARAGGLQPLPWAVYGGNLLVLASNWIPLLASGDGASAGRVDPMAWPLLALAMAVLAVLVGELCRYRGPGRATADAGAAVFALAYVGLLLSFAVQLRVWGIGALGSLIVVTKMGDTGAYAVGRLIGRHKLAPALSPGKTVEGVFGALAFACLGSWATFCWVCPDQAAWWGWVVYGVLVGVAGMVGDLAESLLKRDAGRKDSSMWMPGFGGVLDVLDSILVAAPVAWVCWASGLVGG